MSDRSLLERVGANAQAILSLIALGTLIGSVVTYFGIVMFGDFIRTGDQIRIRLVHNGPDLFLQSAKAEQGEGFFVVTAKDSYTTWELTE